MPRCNESNYHEQFTRILDYDVWLVENFQQKSIPVVISIWQCQEAELSRFINLEEEYPALLGPFIKVFEPDEYENLSDVEQDKLSSFPGSYILQDNLR